ncbi:MAG: type III pantothenate kinase [Gammaproteobacteria bacterium]
MSWLVDMGNTRIRWGLAGGEEQWRVESAVHAGGDVGSVLAGRWSPRGRVDVVSVAGERADDALRSWLESQGAGPVIFHCTPARGQGVINSYIDHAAMGVDRWAAMVGGRAVTDGAFCVIDCGSAVTVDGVDADGRHLGGGILPGYRLMSRALTGETARILAGDRGGSARGLGTDTAACVSSGVDAAVSGGVLELIHRAERPMERPLERLLCGGDAERIRDALEPCRVLPDLVLRGLALMARDRE